MLKFFQKFLMKHFAKFADETYETVKVFEQLTYENVPAVTLVPQNRVSSPTSLKLT